jgi:hypothetical protein
MEKFIDLLAGLENEEQYAHMIWKVLTGYYGILNHESEDIEFINYLQENGQDSLTEALAIIYKNIPNEKRGLFRKAVGDVLLKCAESSESEASLFLDDLISLIGQINAKELLGSLLDLTRREPKLISVCLSSAQEMQPSEELFIFVLDLVRNKHFLDSNIFDAIRVMVDCCPEKTILIIDNLRKRIRGLYIAARSLEKEHESAYWDAVLRNFSYLNGHKEKTALERIAYHALRK